MWTRRCSASTWINHLMYAYTSNGVYYEKLRIQLCASVKKYTLGLMVLKAADRSRKWELIIWNQLLQSAELRWRTDKTVSVEWPLLNPDWSLPSWLFCERTRQYLVVNNSFKCLRQVCNFLQVQVPLAVGLHEYCGLTYLKGPQHFFVLFIVILNDLHQKHYYVVIFHTEHQSSGQHFFA